MKSQGNHHKWLSMLVILSLFLNFPFALPAVYAQGETPPVEPATPTIVSLGATGSIDNGTSGTIYFDEFVSRRETHIGPIQQ